MVTPERAFSAGPRTADSRQRAATLPAATLVSSARGFFDTVHVHTQGWTFKWSASLLHANDGYLDNVYPIGTFRVNAQRDQTIHVNR